MPTEPQTHYIYINVTLLSENWAQPSVNSSINWSENWLLTLT